MSPASAWLRVGADESLSQGEFLRDLTVVGWRDLEAEPADLDPGRDLEIQVVDAVVLTQSCDLEQRKVGLVVLCSAYPGSAHQAAWRQDMARRGQTATDRAWNRHLEALRKRAFADMWWSPGIPAVPDEEFWVVQLGEVFTLPLARLAAGVRGRERWRLGADYRQALIHQFTNFISRPALPV